MGTLVENVPPRRTGGRTAVARELAAVPVQALGAVVLQLVGALLDGGVVSALLLRGSALSHSPRGVLLAAAAGRRVGLAEMLTHRPVDRLP